ncbi:hypothetical protein VNO77_17686 [Canavalia gladiata]|uniref:Uncharacterized protein n=1 Tax=Canavalia gladiata TaxID=3824 RepID=A0AAN9LJL6_CANGL
MKYHLCVAPNSILILPLQLHAILLRTLHLINPTIWMGNVYKSIMTKLLPQKCWEKLQDQKKPLFAFAANIVVEVVEPPAGSDFLDEKAVSKRSAYSNIISKETVAKPALHQCVQIVGSDFGSAYFITSLKRFLSQSLVP